jgi:hypothetical protein
MTDQERNQVLRMIENGNITPEEGLTLMQALDKNPAEDSQSAESASIPADDPEDTSFSENADNADSQPDPNFEGVKAKIRRFWLIPLWAGIAITVLSALGMYAILQTAGLNFWFYFMLFPFLLGVAVTALGAGSRRARWIYVDVHQKSGEFPKRIFLGFPLPLGLTAWFLRTFGPHIPDLRRTNVDDIIQVIESGFTGETPLLLNVDEGKDGERVQVYIG